MGFIRKDIIKINGDIIIYKDEKYEYLDFIKLSKHIKKAVLFILNQDIYIRKIDIGTCKLSEEKINNIKELEFGKEENLLIHYEVDKNKNNVYIYALSEGEKVSCLAKNLKELRVIPIQMQYKKKLEKVVHKKNYQCIFSYLDVFYYLNVEDGHMKICNIYENLYDVLDFIKKMNLDNALYVGSGIKIDEKEKRYIEVGDICNDKVLFK